MAVLGNIAGCALTSRALLAAAPRVQARLALGLRQVQARLALGPPPVRVALRQPRAQAVALRQPRAQAARLPRAPVRLRPRQRSWEIHRRER
jgi:hypothetical protein